MNVHCVKTFDKEICGFVLTLATVAIMVQRVTQDTSAKQRLAEVLLDRSMTEYIAEKRNSTPKWPWRLIAQQLAADTGGQVEVTHETLRQWYGDELASAVEAAAS